MLFWVIVKVGIRSLMANKLRSLLAMLGIVIGVAAVIAMLAIGAGAKKQILSRIMAMGSNLLIIRPAQNQSRGVMSGTQQTLTVADAEAIAAQCEKLGIKAVAPVVSGQAQIKYLSRNTRTSVTGSSLTYLPIRAFEVETGRCFTDPEADSARRVAVIGPVTAQNLFGFNDPLNETIKIKGINFTVIGVLKAKGDQGWFNPDDQAIIPLSIAMKQMFGLDYLREIDIQAQDGKDLSVLEGEVRALLKKRHRIPETGTADFEVRNQADRIRELTDTARTFTFLLGGIASISLLVGGIGIMNIMLVTVTERTREIGVRMAIGAKRSNIRTQFLIESMIISGLGGLIGTTLGVATARLIDWLSREHPTLCPFPASVDPSSILLSVAFSAIVGVFFGWYPSRRAAAMDPVEALRYE
ncbi:MAG: ABC transporter permease [Phycisphaerae bacterium]|jgi:putative ABC transport system permease protein